MTAALQRIQRRESTIQLNFSPESLGGATTRMVLVVEDPDAVFAQVVKARAKAISPVEGRVVASFGHH